MISKSNIFVFRRLGVQEPAQVHVPVTEFIFFVYDQFNSHVVVYETDIQDLNLILERPFGKTNEQVAESGGNVIVEVAFGPYNNTFRMIHKKVRGTHYV